jgi:hypothetical protein
MNLSARDQKLLWIWAALVLVGGLYFLWPASADDGVAVTATDETVELNAKRLSRLRDIAATAPAKQQVLTKVAAELTTREQGLIQAATIPQAQAQIVSLMRATLDQERIDLRGTDMPAVEPIADGAYGLTPVRMQFECNVAQLLNVLAAIAARPQLIATRNLQIQAADTRNKTIRVALTVVGVVPKTLVPVKK